MMNTRIVAGALFAALIVAVAADSAAQAYPNRPVRVIVPSSPGGGTDILTRRLTPGLSQRLGQQVVVDNRPGAGSMIGNALAAQAAPDGYTLLMGISTITIIPSTRKTVPYDVLTDLAPIAQAVAAPNIIVVHPSLPVTTIKGLVAFARQRPGQLNYASAGNGTNPHLAMALFLNMTKLKMTHIPYKGLGPALVEVIAGQVVVMSGTMLSSLHHVKSGRLRGLATTAATRSTALPDLPTVDQAGVKGYVVTQWYGLFAPAGTPKQILSKVHSAVVGTLRSERAKFATDGVETVGNTPEEFARLLRTEIPRWAKVVKAAGLKPL